MAGYIKNNPIKVFLSYYYGLYLSTLLIEEKYKKKRFGTDFNELYYPVMLEVKTKCPFKYMLYDNQTGQKYQGNNEIKGKMWKNQFL